MLFERDGYDRICERLTRSPPLIFRVAPQHVGGRFDVAGFMYDKVRFTHDALYIHSRVSCVTRLYKAHCLFFLAGGGASGKAI